MDLEDQLSDSFGRYSSLASSPRTKQFYTSAALAHPVEEFRDYCFIAVLGLAQRLRINFLPITWEEPRGIIGRGGQARVDQALINLQMSLAFKRFDHKGLEDPFREIVREMILLSEPSISQHQYIVKLEGICWDIEEDDTVWPVLVFEKSLLGDLGDFSMSEAGRSLPLEDRLNICADIGTAIKDMHANNILHGDIKPNNILMWQSDGNYTAKVADFGFSTRFQCDDALISLPRSAPWSGPEHQGQKFQALEAKRMDIYSFSMLCLWLIFGAESFTTIPVTTADHGEDGLSIWVSRLVAKESRFTTDTKDNLTQFFRSSICFDPLKRTINWGYLLSLLAPDRNIPCTQVFGGKIVAKNENFQIALSFWSLYGADFRLRRFITTQLDSLVSNSTSQVFKRISIAEATEQLALCYKIGFGVPRIWEERKMLSLSDVQSATVDNQLQSIKNSEPETFENKGPLHQLELYGFSVFINFPLYYQDKKLIHRAKDFYEREIQDAKEVFGEHHRMNLNLTSELASMLDYYGEWKEAENLHIQVIETRKRVLGGEHEETLRSMTNLVWTYKFQELWTKAEELEGQVVHISSQKYGKKHPFTLNNTSKLALTYISNRRFEEAKELLIEVTEAQKEIWGDGHPETVANMTTLADIHRRQEQWNEAEDLMMEIIRLNEKVFGNAHADTLESISRLIEAYQDQNKWKEAEELGTQVIQRKRKALGDKHLDTLESLDGLATTFWNQGQWKKAEKIYKETLDTRERVFGEDHPSVLASLDSVAFTYWNQRQWKDAEKLYKQILKRRKRVLGDENLRTLHSMEMVASTYRHQDQREKAEKLLMQVLEIRKRVNGKEHTDTLNVMFLLATTLKDQGKDEEAMLLMKECAELRIRVLGPHHRHTETSLRIVDWWENEDTEYESTVTPRAMSQLALTDEKKVPPASI